MDKFNIGFIGGCINNQKSIGKDNLYFSVLSKLISSARVNSDLKISLGRYLSYDHLVQQAEEFLDKKNPDLIFVFIRPFPLMPLQKPIIKYDKAGGKTGRALHPALFTRTTEWNKKLTAHQKDEGINLRTRNKFELRDLNLVAGFLLGLHRWALNYISQQLNLIHLLCKERNTTFIVISPPKNPESVLANIICKRTSKYLHKFCRRNHIGFVDINKLALENFEKDNIHFNINGHRKLGLLLYNEIIANRHLASHYHTQLSSPAKG